MTHKVGRNDPCPGGSGTKFKHCRGRAGNLAPVSATPPDPWGAPAGPHDDDALFGADALRRFFGDDAGHAARGAPDDDPNVIDIG